MTTASCKLLKTNMKHLCTIILAAILCATATAQTVRTLAYNISNNVVIGATNANALTFSNSFAWSTNTLAAVTRTNLGLGWTGLTNTNASAFRSALDLSAAWLTNTNVANFRSAIGLGATNDVHFDSLQVDGGINMYGVAGIVFDDGDAAATTRTNLGLGATWLTNTNVTNFRTAIGLGATNNVEFNELRLGNSGQMHIRGAAGNISFYNSIESENVLLIPADTDPVEINSQWNNAGVRTNLGLPLAALTNTSNVTMMRTLSGSTNTNHPFSGSISVTGTNNTNTLVFSNGILQSVQ